MHAAEDRLRTLALVWGEPDRPVVVVGELLRVPPGPPTDEVDRLLAGLDDQERAVLAKLDRSGADGRWNGGPGPRRPWWPRACSRAATNAT